jgi:hypothetical protein
MAVLWVVALCSLVEVYRRFTCAFFLHYQGDECLMMEAASTSETSANFFQTTWCGIVEDSNLYTRHRENQKSHKVHFDYQTTFILL